MAKKKKYKKINYQKCDKPYKEMFHGICFNMCINLKCSINKEVCMAYAKWDKSDGNF